VLLFFSFDISFVNSLAASLNGWVSPINPILFGPSRKWHIAISFRSISVKKATEISKGKMVIVAVIFKGFPFYES